MKFILLINVKMPTIVGILTFMINGDLILKFPNILAILNSIYEQFSYSAELSMKKVV